MMTPKQKCLEMHFLPENGYKQLTSNGSFDQIDICFLEWVTNTWSSE